MKSKPLFLTFLILIIFSCKKQQEDDCSFKKFTIQEIDSLFNKNALTKKEHESKSVCGGGLDGYYFKDQLVLLEATYSAELGYSYKKMYLFGNEFSKIIYKEHFAEWEKYDQHIPDSKITYSDTLYTITPLKNNSFKVYSYEKYVHKIEKPELLNDLINCGNSMIKELKNDIDELKIDSSKYIITSE